MRHFSGLLLSLLTTLFLIAPGSHAYAQDHEPRSAIRSITIDEVEQGHVYASDDSYLYRSTDDGDNWLRVASDLMVHSIDLANYASELAGGDTRVFLAAAQDRGVVRSLDGETWADTVGISASVHALAIHPVDGSLFAGTQDAIYKSVDRGASWQVLSDLPSRGTIHGIEIDPNNPLVMYATNYGRGVYRSTDGGLTWLPGTSGLTNLQLWDLEMHPDNASVLFAGTTGGVFQSVDAGASWVQLTPIQYARDIVIDPMNSDHLIVASDGSGLVESFDGGQTWGQIEAGLDGASKFESLAIATDGSGRLFAGTDYEGMFASTDNGAGWVRITESNGPPVINPPPPPPAQPTTLTASIVDLNGGKVELGDRAYFEVVIRNTGSEAAVDATVRLFWVQNEYPNSYRSLNISAPGGSCNADTCTFGSIPPNGEIRISADGSTSSEWVGPFRLSTDGSATNSNEFYVTKEVSVTRSVLSVEAGGGGSAGALLIFGLLVLALARGRGMWLRS